LNIYGPSSAWVPDGWKAILELALVLFVAALFMVTWNISFQKEPKLR
jgi:hypothetical protein